MTSDDTAGARADLTIEVYTTPGRTFTSSIPPEGPGDEPTWSPMSATLIYGDHDAVLVDAWATYDQADALADWIDTKRRRLSRIYITHGHGDHWLGLARLIQRFPGATGLATAEVLAQATDPSMARYWDAIFPGEIPPRREGAAATPDSRHPRSGRQRATDPADRPGRHRALHRPARTVAGRRRHRRPGLQPGAHDDRRDRRTRTGKVDRQPGRRRRARTRRRRRRPQASSTTTTTRKSSPNPSNTCGTSPGSPLRRPPRPASSPG